MELTAYQGKCGYDIIMRLLGKKGVGSVPTVLLWYKGVRSPMMEAVPYWWKRKVQFVWGEVPVTVWVVEARSTVCLRGEVQVKVWLGEARGTVCWERCRTVLLVEAQGTIWLVEAQGTIWLAEAQGTVCLGEVGSTSARYSLFGRVTTNSWEKPKEYFVWKRCKGQFGWGKREVRFVLGRGAINSLVDRSANVQIG